MRKTHEPKAALKALIAALGVSTMVLATQPAHAGPLSVLKKAAAKELKKEAARKLGIYDYAVEQAAVNDEGGGLWNVATAAAADGVADLVVGAGTGSPPQVRVIDGQALAADAEPQDAYMYFETTRDPATGKIKPSWKVEEGVSAAGDDRHKDWIIIESMSGGNGFRGGVFVASGDVNGDGRDDIIVGPGLCKLVQNGTTVATAEDILANLSDEEELLWSKAKTTHNMTASCAKMSQNGTTVATASEVAAPNAQEQILVGLLLPAVQAVRAAPRPQRAGMSQNGTRVPSADTVKAPETEGEASLLLPAVQSAREAARAGKSKPQRAGMSQNGTTVPSADTVKAPEDPHESMVGYLKICGVEGESND